MCPSRPPAYLYELFINLDSFPGPLLSDWEEVHEEEQETIAVERVLQDSYKYSFLWSQRKELREIIFNNREQCGITVSDIPATIPT